MRVFVVGTGRCGTTTFSNACKHITNYTCSHESQTHNLDPNTISLDYPDNHIEIDPRLSYWISTIKRKYPSAMFFHLYRDEKTCIESLSKRTSLVHFSTFHFGRRKSLECSAYHYYHNTMNLLADYKYIKGLKLEALIESDFETFVNDIKGQCNYELAYLALKKKHNQS